MPDSALSHGVVYLAYSSVHVYSAAQHTIYALTQKGVTRKIVALIGIVLFANGNSANRFRYLKSHYVANMHKANYCPLITGGKQDVIIWVQS